MDRCVIYVHGQGGSADEAARFAPLFDGGVYGFDYRADAPWEAEEEFPPYFRAMREKHGRVILLANSVGAYYSMAAGVDAFVSRAFFISPVVDMERMIAGMMRRAGVGEDELREKGVVRTASGTLSWAYLAYVRAHPLSWNAPTEILCAEGDRLVPLETVRAFAGARHAGLTVMEGGEHWFHTAEELRFLDRWLAEKTAELP